MNFTLKKYIEHKLYAKGLNGIHSPFLFKMMQRYQDFVIPDEDKMLLKKIRIGLKHNQDVFEKREFNTELIKSRGEYKNQKIGDEYKAASITEKKGDLIYFLAQYFNPENVLELGTNLGLSSLYLQLGNGNPKKMVSIEGCKPLSDFANKLHEQYIPMDKFKTSDFQTGSFIEVLPKVLDDNFSLDFVYNDGDHRGEAVLQYYELILPHLKESSVFALDDIYWSPSMYQAFIMLSKRDEVTLSVDFFHTGLLFFNRSLSQENIRVRI